MLQQFFATTAKGIEGLLLQEIKDLGAIDAKETRAGVHFNGDLALAYKVCLWTRLANQVLLPLLKFTAPTPNDLYQELQKIDWLEHIASNGSLRIDVDGKHDGMNNTQFIAQKAKDAIVDQIRAKVGSRPSVQLERPDVVLHLYVQRNEFTLSLNLSGDSLHRRGYRLEGGRAPLKENLAAAILIRAGWPTLLKQGKPGLLDPMCGSGTLLIEAAMMAYDIAPGLKRDYYGFIGWRGHRKSIWQQLIGEASARREAALGRPFTDIKGFDSHPNAITISNANIARAGLAQIIQVQLRDARELSRDAVTAETGLIVCNPPYGERLNSGEETELRALFSAFGQQLQQNFSGWELSVFTGSPALLKSLGIRSYKMYHLYNGAIPADVLNFHIDPQYFMRYESVQEKLARQSAAAELTEQGRMFANRLRKNLKHLSKWAAREAVTCYRIYDADLPDYAIAIDWYEGKWLHVQEYQADKTIDPKKAEHRLLEAVAAIQDVMQVTSRQVFVKVRQRQKGENQYEKLNETRQYEIVHEAGAKFYVNFTDYLDTGLFLDHRIMRKLVAESAWDKQVLNLFAYTCTASVHAAMAGARLVTSVDLSNTYLEWGQRNFYLNNIDCKRHHFIQADCLTWLAETRAQYDVIFLDPPTFSNSKRMEGTLDIQRDHVELIKLTMRHLAPDGILYFSNNYRRFKLDHEALAEYSIQDISQRCLPEDFARRPNIHHCWRIIK